MEKVNVSLLHFSTIVVPDCCNYKGLKKGDEGEAKTWFKGNHNQFLKIVALEYWSVPERIQRWRWWIQDQTWPNPVPTFCISWQP